MAGTEKNAVADWAALLLSIVSILIAGLSLYFSHTREILVDLKGFTRDWQKALIFSTLLDAGKPLSIEEIESRYITSANKYRDKYNLRDANFSREEIYSVLIDLISNQSLRLRDSKNFSVRADDDNLQDRRVAFDMLKYALDHEFAWGYDDFAVHFAAWYNENRGAGMTKDRALSVLSLAIQSNIIGMSVKPGTRITCLGEVLPLFVGSAFSVRGAAPVILPMPGQLQQCPPK